MNLKEQLSELGNIMRSAWRFRWSALLVGVVVGLAGSVLVLLVPPQYESHAQIYVDTRSVLRPLLQGLAVTAQARDDTDVVRGTLLSRPTLDRVARDTGLYSRVDTPEEAEKLLTDLATLIYIKGDSSSGLYRISYLDRSARTARAVVQTLLDTFMQNSIGAGRSEAQSAEAFLAQQVGEYAARLSASEQRIADFKKKNVGMMPDQRGDYFTRLEAAIAARSKLQTDLAVAIQRREALRGKLASGAQGNSAHAPPPTAQQIQAAQALDERIRESKLTLDRLLERYTEDHPNVIAQKQAIGRLEQERARELGTVRSTNPVRGGGAPLAVDPVIQNLQMALDSDDAQIAALEMQLKRSEAGVAELQRTLTVGPEIEAELARLNRDYGVTKVQYETLLQRLEFARLSSDADRSDALRFKILETPRMSLRPVKPSKGLLLVGVLFAAVAVSCGFGVLRAQALPVFFSKAAVSAALNVTVIGIVSRAYWSGERAARRRERLAYIGVAACFVVCIAATAAFSSPLSLMLRDAIGWGRE